MTLAANLPQVHAALLAEAGAARRSLDRLSLDRLRREYEATFAGARWRGIPREALIRAVLEARYPKEVLES